MSFHHLDQFAHTASPVTRMPPAGRIVGTVGLALVAATLPAGAWLPLGVLVALSCTLFALARVPPDVALVRLAWPLGVVLIASATLLVMVPGPALVRLGPLTVTAPGADRFATVMARAMVALLPAVLLVSTTSFPELLHGLRALRVPGAVATALGLAYRFLYLTLDELERLQRAARSRNAGHGAARRRHLLVAVTAATLGRSLARGERTHDAMLARGFAGTLPLLHVSPWTPQAAIELAMLLTVAAAVAVQARVG